MKKGRTFTTSLIEIFLDLYENGNESYLQSYIKDQQSLDRSLIRQSSWDPWETIYTFLLNQEMR